MDVEVRAVFREEPVRKMRVSVDHTVIDKTSPSGKPTDPIAYHRLNNIRLTEGTVKDKRR